MFNIWDPGLSSTTTTTTTPPTTVTVTTRVRLHLSFHLETWYFSKYVDIFFCNLGSTHNNATTEFDHNWHCHNNNNSVVNNNVINNNNNDIDNICHMWNIDSNVLLKCERIRSISAVTSSTGSTTPVSMKIISAKDYEEQCVQPVALMNTITHLAMFPAHALSMFMLFTKMNSMFNPNQQKINARQKEFLRRLNVS